MLVGKLLCTSLAANKLHLLDARVAPLAGWDLRVPLLCSMVSQLPFQEVPQQGSKLLHAFEGLATLHYIEANGHNTDKTNPTCGCTVQASRPGLLSS